MYVYNVTIAVSSEVEEDWLWWMENIHIPEVLETGFFTGYAMYKVLLNKEGDPSYSIQYNFKEMKDLQLYQAKEAPSIQQKHTERYRDKVTAFRTVLQKVL